MKSKIDPNAERGAKAGVKRRPIVFTAINKPDYELAARLMVPLFLDWLSKQAVHAGGGGGRLHLHPPSSDNSQ